MLTTIVIAYHQCLYTSTSIYIQDSYLRTRYRRDASKVMRLHTCFINTGASEDIHSYWMSDSSFLFTTSRLLIFTKVQELCYNIQLVRKNKNCIVALIVLIGCAKLSKSTIRLR
jgi:hypothetical protein